MKLRGAVVLLLMIVFGSGYVAAKKKPKPSETELAAVTARGRLLAEADAACWHASDAVIAQKPAAGLVRRYIPQKNPTGWTVAFGRLNDAKDRFLVAFEAVGEPKPQGFSVKRFEPPREDTGFNLAAARAIAAASAEFQPLPNVSYNVAVVPAGENIAVYFYPAQTRSGVFPLGGDIRYTTSGDGLTILERRQLHKTVIEFSAQNTPGKTAAGFHSHVLSELPEDTDVMHVLLRTPKVPEYVSAGDYVFTIEDDGRIKVK